MSGRLLETDPITKKRSVFYSDHDGRELIVHTEFDVEDVIETAKGAHAQVDERARYGEMDRVATVPLCVLFDWERDWRAKGLSEAEKERDLRRRLDDPDNRFMRTRPGRLSR